MLKMGGKKRKIEAEEAAAAAATAAAAKKRQADASSSEGEESSSTEGEERDDVFNESIISNSSSKKSPKTVSKSSKTTSNGAKAKPPEAKSAPLSASSSSPSSSSESESIDDDEESEAEEATPPPKKRKTAANPAPETKKAPEKEKKPASSTKKNGRNAANPSVEKPKEKPSSPMKSFKKESLPPKNVSSVSSPPLSSRSKKTTTTTMTAKDSRHASSAAKQALTNGVHLTEQQQQRQKQNERLSEQRQQHSDEWTDESTLRLLDNLSASLPASDTLKFQTQQDKINWESIAFDHFDAPRCKAKWAAVVKTLRTFKTMSDLVSEASQSIRLKAESTDDSGEESSEGTSFPDPLWIQFFKAKCQEYSGKKSDYFKSLTEKFESMSSSEKDRIRQHQLDDMKAFIDKMTKEENEKEVERIVTLVKAPSKPPTPLSIFATYAKERMQNNERFSGLSTAERTKKIRRNWEGMEGSKKIKFILESMEEVNKYEDQVRRLKELHPGLATDRIPDTVNVLTKSDLAVYDSHQGIPTKPPKTGYSAFTQEKLSSGRLKEIEPLGRMAKIAQLWKDLSEEERTVWAIKTKSAWEAWRETVANLPDDVRKRMESRSKSTSTSSSAAAAAADSRPQKPFDAIRVFIEEKKEKFGAKNPDLTASELNRRLTAKYNELGDDKKNKYKKKALALKEEHQREREASGASPAKDAPASKTAKKKETKQKKEKKPPMNGYSLFSQECMRDAEMMKGVENTKKMALISRKWKELTDAERQAYTNRSRADWEEFVAAHPDSDFVVAYLAKRAKKSASSSTDAASAHSTAAAAAATPTPLKDKKMDFLKPTATSTPKSKLPSADEEEDEEEEDEESCDESVSESDSDDAEESVPIAKTTPLGAASGVTAAVPMATAATTESSSEEDSSDEEDDDDDDDDATAAATDVTPAAKMTSAETVTKAESSDEEDDDDDAQAAATAATGVTPVAKTTSAETVMKTGSSSEEEDDSDEEEEDESGDED